MDEKSEHYRDLISLIEEVHDGVISEERLVALDEMLKNDAQARRLYLEYAFVHSGLDQSLKLSDCSDVDLDSYNKALWELSAEEAIAPAIELPLEKVRPELIQHVQYQKREYKLNKQSLFTVLVSTAAIVLVVLFARYAPIQSGKEVATLSESMNAKWGNSSVTLPKGHRFVTGEDLFLQEGLVELSFDYGVQITFEAPVLFHILTDDQINLQYGMLYAEVPQRAIGFTVNTPSARIIDLGTEFGIEANFQGDTSLHVVKGKTVLIGGDKSNKVSLEVSKGNAKRVSSHNQSISDITYNSEYFAREIDPANGLVWRGQSEVNLADIVGGGNGFGTGAINHGIDITTGESIPDMMSFQIQVGPAGYRDVKDNRFIDGVFIPGLVDETTIASDGSISFAFPKTSGNYWGGIFNGAFHQGLGVPRHTLKLNGDLMGGVNHPSISIHSNQGITFDLNEIRETLPDGKITQFRSVVGISETVKEYAAGDQSLDAETLSQQIHSSVEFWVFLDGKEVYRKEMTDAEKAVPLEIPIDANQHFLTLVVTEAGYAWGYDWALFERPELVIEPAQ